MEEFRNLNGKRVCDITLNHREAIIVDKGYITRITANSDGTLNVENVPVPKAA